MNALDHKGGFTDAGLKKQITVDMSAPVVGGKNFLKIVPCFIKYMF